MNISPSAFERVSARITQISVAILLLVALALVVLAGMARTRLVKLQQGLAPLIERQLSQSLGRAVHIGGVQVRGLSSVVITDATVANGATFASGTAFSSPRTVAHVNLLQLAITRGKNPTGAISTVTLQRPTLEVARSKEGRWSFQDILNHFKTQPAQAAEWHGKVYVNDARVAYRDARGFGDKPQRIAQDLRQVNGRIVLARNDDYRFVVSARGGGRRLGSVRLAGNYTAKDGVTRLKVNADDLVVKEIARFLPKGLPITFENGTAALRLAALHRSLPKPEVARRLPQTELTAEVDLSGVGLRLRELNTPIMATSGRLRLVHDRDRYPAGSRLELINVQARAHDVPVRIAGNISEINLFDLAHANPRFDVDVKMDTKDGARLRQLFSKTGNWPRALSFAQRVGMAAHVSGLASDIKIAGTLHSDRVNVNDLSGEGVDTTFALRPAADGRTPGVVSVQATSTLKRVRLGQSEFSGLRITAGSTTPWEHLNDAPHVTGTAVAQHVHLPWFDADRVDTAFVGTRAGIQLSDVQAAVFGGHTASQITVPFRMGGDSSSDLVRARVQYRGVDLQQIARALHVDDLSGAGDGTLALQVDPQGMVTLNTDITGSQVRYRDYLAPRVTATVAAQSQRGALQVRIARAAAQTEYGAFTVADGAYTRNGAQGALALPLQGERIPLARFSEQFKGTGSMQGTLTGDLASPVLTAVVSAENGALQRYTFQRAQADMVYRAGDLRFRNIRVFQPGMTIEMATSGEGIDPRQGTMGLGGTVHLQGAVLNDVLAFFGQTLPWRIDGGVQGDVDFTLGPEGPVASGEGAIPNAVVHIPAGGGEYPLRLSSLRMGFDLSGRRMTIRDLQVDKGSSTLHAQGTASCPVGEPVSVDVAFRGDRTMLQELPLDLLGIPVPLSGQAEIRGTLKGALNGTGAMPLTAQVTAASPQASVSGVPVGAASTDLTYTYRPDDRQLIINQGTVRNAAFAASTEGRYLLSDRRYDGVKLAVDRIDLGALPKLAAQAKGDSRLSAIAPLLAALPKDIAGNGHTEIAVSGSFAKPTATVGLGFTQLSLDGTPLPNVRATLAAETVNGRYRLRIQEAVADGGAGSGQARLSGTVDPSGDVDLRVSAQDITSKVLSAWVGELPVDGRLQMAATIRGAWQRPVVDGDVQVTDADVSGVRVSRVAAHLRLEQNRLVLSDGVVAALAGAPPMAVQGEVPVRWLGPLRPQIPTDRPIALAVDLPRQSLSALRAFVPVIPAMDGTVEGALRVGGSIAAPRVTEGRLQLAGSFDLPQSARDYANRLNDIDVRLNITNDGRQTLVAVNRLSATLDRMEDGRRAGGFQPGWVSSEGSIRIPAGQMQDPERWQWDLYGKVIRLPLSASLFLVPQASGFVHLSSEGGTPVLQGVVFAEQAKIKEPKIAASGKPSWGPFSFSPRLSVVLQVGEGVKLAKSIFRIPLLPSSLPRPGIPTVIPGVLPALDINTRQQEYEYNAAMMNPGTAGELPGTWGVVTGTLDDPRLYVRFEVDKHKLSFPLNLIGSVRHAKGHITYSLAEGPNIAMGIPDWPTQETGQAQGTPVAKAAAPAAAETPPADAAPPAPDSGEATPATIAAP